MACFQLGYYSYGKFLCVSIIMFIIIIIVGNSFSRRKTAETFPIIYSGFNCRGSEAKLSSCGSGLNSYIQYCTNDAVEINCEGELY